MVAIKVLARAGSYLKAQVGKMSLPSSLDCWQSLRSLGREEEEGKGEGQRESLQAR